jgi:D-alanyl-D-alanine dipeptidase
MAHTETFLVNIQKINPKILVEVVYATSGNFTGQIIYDSAQCYVHFEVAQALSAVQEELERMGLGLKIWDGYSPCQLSGSFGMCLHPNIPMKQNEKSM